VAKSLRKFSKNLDAFFDSERAARQRSQVLAGARRLAVGSAQDQLESLWLNRGEPRRTAIVPLCDRRRWPNKAALGRTSSEATL
jgi:hypothetical protein